MKITINYHISLNELTDVLSDNFKNYIISNRHNVIYIYSQDFYFNIKLSGKEINLSRTADFGDVFLFLIPILGWGIIAARNNISNNSKAKEILDFIESYYNLNEGVQSNKIQIPTVCPNCKNPNTKKIRLCEWCGNQII